MGSSVPPDDTGLSGPIPQITLPDVNVTPDNEPPKTAPAAGLLLPGSDNPPSLSDSMMTARLAGYQWPEIDGHIAQAQDTAARAGYTDAEVEAAVGKPKPLDTFGPLPYTDLKLDPQFPTQGISRPFAPGEYMKNPDGSWSSEMSWTVPVNGKPSIVPGLWLMNGQPTHVDEDQASRLAENSGLSFPSYGTMDEADAAANERESQWQNKQPGDTSVPSLWTGKVYPNAPPTPREATDYPIGVAQDAMLPNLAAAKNAQDNMLDMAQKTNTPLAEMYQAAHSDPLFQDALTSAPGPDAKEPPEPRPYPPSEPTLADLEKPNKDAINHVYFLPGEELPFEHSLRGALTDAGVDALMYTGGALAGRYIIAPIARKVMELAAPKLSEMGGTIKEVLSDESGQLGERPGIGHNMPPEKIDDINSAADKINSARLVRPPELPVPAGIDYTARRGGFSNLEDELNRLRTNDTADKINLLQVIDALPAEWRKDSFQDKVSSSVEQRMVDGGHQHPEDVQDFLDTIRGLTNKQYALGKSIDEMLHGDAEKYDPSLRIKSVDEGYMHRIRQDAEPPVGEAGEQQEAITSGYGRPRTLSGYAPGMQAREEHFVFDNGNGVRNWGQNKLDAYGYEMGQKVESPDGQTWTVKPATMAEIEANTSIKYNKNYLLNTVENVARLARVERNLRFMDTVGKALEKQGQFVRETPGKFQPAPNGMLPIDIPQMKGWAIPSVAHPLNDFFQDLPQGSFLNALRAGNRMLLNTMFVNPLIHSGNMAFQWFYGRGADWIRPAGYGRLIRSMMSATEEVNNMGPRYREHLREGAGLQYGQTQVENFWKLAQDKMIRDMVADPETMEPYAKAFGVKLAELYPALLKWSKSHMWNWGDRMALARQFELQEKGMSTREAIFQAEKDINNYRVPSQVLGSHAVHQALTDPAFSAFGRYRFGLVRSMALMARDLVKGSADERIDAIAKATLIAGMTLGVWPAINYGLSQLPGNFQLEEFGLGAMLGNVARLRNLPTDQGAWISALGSLVDVSPMLQLASQLTSNRDILGRPIINWSGSKGGIAGEALEEGLRQIMPGQVLLDAMKAPNAEQAVARVLGSLVKLKAHNTVDPKKQAQWQKRDQAEAYSQERRNAFVNWFSHIFGGAPPPPAGRVPMHGTPSIPYQKYRGSPYQRY